MPAARDPLTDALASARSAAPGPSAAHAPPAADGAAGAADATHDAAAEPPAADAAGDDVSAQPPRPSGVPPATRTASGTLFTGAPRTASAWCPRGAAYAGATPRAAPSATEGATARRVARASHARRACLTRSGWRHAEDDAGPDWTEPEAWTQAADFIVQVHTQMPGELLHEAQRGLAISALLVDKVVEKLGPCLGTRRRAEPAPPVQQQQQPSTRADK